jgi:hypothetical protein
MAGKFSWDQANRRQKLGLVWRIRKKISQIIKDYFYLPFFLLIILWNERYEDINAEQTLEKLARPNQTWRTAACAAEVALCLCRVCNAEAFIMGPRLGPGAIQWSDCSRRSCFMLIEGTVSQMDTFLKVETF